jgi:hypothetical protein
VKVPDFTVTSVLPGCVCQPVDEFGPNVKSATMVFVPGVAAKPVPFGIDPAPITSATTEPVGPVATATPVRAIARMPEPDEDFIVLADPEGNLFCVIQKDG